MIWRGERFKLFNRYRNVIEYVGLYAVWVALAAFAVLTAFQIHATLIYIGILVVENPNLRPPGWNTGSIYGLSRLLVLILGVLWLGAIMFSEGYLREGLRLHLFRNRIFCLAIILLGVYGISYGVLILLS